MCGRGASARNGVKMSDKLTMEGEIEIVEQEGGYAAAAIEIGGESLSWKMEETFISVRDLDRDSHKLPGKWRITVEKLQ